MSESVRAYWESQASGFDDEPDHGLKSPTIRAAWRNLLLAHLPPAPADVVDLGCGTGTLSVLLAESGYRVEGLDLADAMVSAAAGKAAAAGVQVGLQRGDAAVTPYAPGSFDVVVSRHVLWALPDPSAALRRWCGLLRPDGRLVLVEGRWSTGAGLGSQECMRLLRQHRSSVEVHQLRDEALWGHRIEDERYLAVSAC